VSNELTAPTVPAGGLVTLSVVARHLNKSDRTLKRWSEAGKFPRYELINGRRYLLAADVTAWLAARGWATQHAA
jgi:hypothetical protein